MQIPPELELVELLTTADVQTKGRRLGFGPQLEQQRLPLLRGRRLISSRLLKVL
jgi:hypothetical protein